MSMEYVEEIMCPKCKAKGRITIWQSVNTQINPETRDKILSGEIFRYRCSKCGNETNVLYDMLYHQMEDQIMIQLVTKDETVDDVISSFEKMADGTLMPGVPFVETDYTFRIVRNPNQLREKVYIFNQGLDDRVIEIMKLVIGSDLMEKYPDLRISEAYLEINDGAPEYFSFNVGNGQWGNVAFNQGLYDAIKNDGVALDKGGGQYFVDQDWAMEHVALWNHK